MSLDTETGHELERATARVRELERRVDELGRRLLEADGRRARMAELEVEMREAALAGVELQRAQERLEELGASHDAAVGERDRANAALANMRDSVSWRLTAPLRKLKSIVRRGR